MQEINGWYQTDLYFQTDAVYTLRLWVIVILSIEATSGSTCTHSICGQWFERLIWNRICRMYHSNRYMHWIYQYSNHVTLIAVFCKCFQVVTNACPIKHVNMYTVEKRDFKRFDAPFRLEMGRTTTSIGAFLTFFDIEFTEGMLPITFSTQPGWPQTFWKPLIFFLSIDDFEVGDSETFYGVFRMNTLSDDYRKIDWNIEVMYQSQRSRFRDQWHFQTRWLYLKGILFIYLQLHF